MSDREAMFKEMVRQFPDSPMGHFSLGRLLVDEKRWPEAVAALSDAVRLDPTYAAALVALGDTPARARRPRRRPRGNAPSPRRMASAT